MVIVGKITDMGTGKTKAGKDYSWIELEGREKMSNFNGLVARAGICVGDKVKIAPWSGNVKYIDAIERVAEDVQTDLTQLKQAPQRDEAKEKSIDNAVYLKVAAEIYQGCCDRMTSDADCAEIANLVIRMKERLMVLDGKK